MSKRKSNIIKAVFVLILSFTSFALFAQMPTDSVPKDPASLSVYTVQNMNFGAFSPGSSGGTLTLSAMGVRTSTGTVLPLNLGFSYNQSIFEIEGPPGTIISISNGPNAILTGSNGGTMTLQLGASNPAAPFSNNIAPPGRTLINIGGTLTVGSTATTIPGTYSGTFYITFNQE